VHWEVLQCLWGVRGEARVRIVSPSRHAGGWRCSERERLEGLKKLESQENTVDRECAMKLEGSQLVETKFYG
jgi:hypothetical protein